jgi:hypothetical protein
VCASSQFGDESRGIPARPFLELSSEDQWQLRSGCSDLRPHGVANLDLPDAPKQITGPFWRSPVFYPGRPLSGLTTGSGTLPKQAGRLSSILENQGGMRADADGRGVAPRHVGVLGSKTCLRFPLAP